MTMMNSPTSVLDTDREESLWATAFISFQLQCVPFVYKHGHVLLRGSLNELANKHLGKVHSLRLII